MAETEQTIEEQLESLHANMKFVLHSLAANRDYGLTDEQLEYVRTVYNDPPV